VALAGTAALAGAALAASPRLEQLSDAPDPQHVRATGRVADFGYADALQHWQRAEDINAWIGARFEYDRERALALSESARAGQAQRIAILEPEAFYAAPRGVCVDLARFAVSMLRRIDPDAQATYLMIEFEPVQVQGQWLRRHWLAAFRRDGAWWFFADSKRPGHLAGPYDTVEQFLDGYAQYRGRPILSHRLLPSYERRMRTQAAVR
jgi:hypothetical protein